MYRKNERDNSKYESDSTVDYKVLLIRVSCDGKPVFHKPYLSAKTLFVYSCTG